MTPVTSPNPAGVPQAVAIGLPRTERILICDELSSEALAVFEAHGFAPETRVGLKEEELVAIARGAHALVVRSATKVTRRVIEAASELRIVGRAGVGVDNVDVDTATARGVVVMNAPAGNSTTTAELAIALMLALARNVVRGDRATRAGEWKLRGKLQGSEIAGKTLGVIGLGRIGRVVAERGRGLAMDVIAHDPYLLGPKSPVQGVELLPLDELLARADFVSLHVPLSDSTRNLISRERLARMKPGARLINCARGGLVDEVALAQALQSKHLRGAALDVFEREPPPADHPLLAREDVILTPHLGASSEEAQRSVAIEIAEQICEFLIEGVARNAVNLPQVSAQTLRAIAPFVLLAEKMGTYLAQACDSPIRTIEVSISGEIARQDTSHVRLALLVGVLRHGACSSPSDTTAVATHCLLGGMLALSIESPEENALVMDEFFADESTPIWAGGLRVNGRWMWNGMTEFGWTNWGPGEPSNDDCMIVTQAGTWDAVDCEGGNAYRFVCELT
jgi:D-3-phosphoglycerate dehydrogenase